VLTSPKPHGHQTLGFSTSGWYRRLVAAIPIVIEGFGVIAVIVIIIPGIVKHLVLLVAIVRRRKIRNARYGFTSEEGKQPRRHAPTVLAALNLSCERTTGAMLAHEI
jgi:hypothetical protein